jgi:membrane protease subunit HflK
MAKDDQTIQGTESSEEHLKGRFSIRRWWSVCKAAGRYTRRLSTSVYSNTRNAFALGSEVRILDDIKGAFSHIPLRGKSFVFIVLGLLPAGYALSGVYTVRPGEEAVTRIFGKEVRQLISEGLHYRFPWPFEAVEKVNVMEIRRVDLGISAPNEPIMFPRNNSSNMTGHAGHEAHGGAPGATERPRRAADAGKDQFLTGDENILNTRMNIQYRVKSAADYLFNSNAPDSFVPIAARAAVTEIFGGMKVDDLLTIAKSQMQKKIALKTQRMLDAYGTGLQIVHVNLQEVNPPSEAAQAFRDVASAKEEREETVNKAQGYWNSVIPEARGEAHQIISEARGYKEEVINRARGEAEKFSVMLAEFRNTRGVTESRLYLETIEKILARAKKFVVDSKKEQVNIKFVK